MGRAPCCEKVGLKRGRWTAEEDRILTDYIQTHGEGAWRSLPKNAGLLRCGKSCRLRWINYLRADVKRGNITPEEEETIVKLHYAIGNRWSLIAGQLPGRTDNEIKNYWNSHLSRKIYSFRARLNSSAANLVDITKLAKACKKKNVNINGSSHTTTMKKQLKPFSSSFPKYYNTNRGDYNQVLLESRKCKELNTTNRVGVDEIRTVDHKNHPFDETNNLLLMGPHHNYGTPNPHMNIITPSLPNTNSPILLCPTIEQDNNSNYPPPIVNEKDIDPINGGFWGPQFDNWQLDFILDPTGSGFNGGLIEQRENVNLVGEDEKNTKLISGDDTNYSSSVNSGFDDRELLDWAWTAGGACDAVAGRDDQLGFYDDETDKILYWLWENADPDGVKL